MSAFGSIVEVVGKDLKDAQKLVRIFGNACQRPEISDVAIRAAVATLLANTARAYSPDNVDRFIDGLASSAKYTAFANLGAKGHG